MKIFRGRSGHVGEEYFVLCLVLSARCMLSNASAHGHLYV